MICYTVNIDMATVLKRHSHLQQTTLFLPVRRIALSCNTFLYILTNSKMLALVVGSLETSCKKQNDQKWVGSNVYLLFRLIY